MLPFRLRLVTPHGCRFFLTVHLSSLFCSCVIVHFKRVFFVQMDIFIHELHNVSQYLTAIFIQIHSSFSF